MPQNSGKENSGRPRGILSPADRDWLRGEKEYSHASTESRRKSTVRERVENALLDFRPLLDELDIEQIHDIFAEADADALADARVAALGFWYLAGLGLDDGHPDRAFEEAIEDGLEEAFAKSGTAVGGTNATISVGRVDLLQALLDAREGDGDLSDLSMAQLRRLHLTGWVGFDEYVSAVETKRE